MPFIQKPALGADPTKMKIDPATGMPTAGAAGASMSPYVFGGGTALPGPDTNMGPMQYAPGSAPQPTAPGYPPGYNASNAPDWNPVMQSHYSASPGYTSGPPGSSGGLTASQPYGYGTSPGSSNRGYYEQQTPVGSFAAADPARQAGQQYSQANTAYNPYIGQTSQGAAGQNSVMPYAAAAATYATRDNPYLNQSTAQAQGAGTNPYAGSNPYLNSAIQSAQGDVTRNFNEVVQPQLAAMNQAAGSFGNTGVQGVQSRAFNDLGRNLANIDTGMRMQDYAQQQQLAENALNRTQGLNTFNATLGANDLGRQTSGWLQGAGLGLQGLGQQLGAAQFDAGLGQGNNQFNATLGAQDLGRNASLMQNMGQYNAGALNTNSMFNAGQGNNLNMYNTGQANALNMYNTGQANNMLTQVRALGEQGRQFDAGLDYNIDNSNYQRGRNTLYDTLGLYDYMNKNIDAAGNVGNTIQNTPLSYWQMLNNGATSMAGLGNSINTPYFGNPVAGFWGGYNLWNPTPNNP